MDSTTNQRPCLRDGELLVCCEHGCHISVYKSCMGFKPCVEEKETRKRNGSHNKQNQGGQTGLSPNESGGVTLKGKTILVEADVNKRTRVNVLVELDVNVKRARVEKKTQAANSSPSSSHRGTHTPLARRVIWSDEEVAKLEEGVNKYVPTARKNLSWKKILEFGRDTFHSSRSPSDLKDKWRNITK